METMERFDLERAKRTLKRFDAGEDVIPAVLAARLLEAIREIERRNHDGTR
jgi:hypothetical protein